MRSWPREGRTFFDAEASNGRRKSIDEDVAMSRPPRGIGKLKNLAVPVCACSGICHVTGNRAEHWSNDSRLNSRNLPSKELFAVTTHRLPQRRIEVIDGFMAQVCQVERPRARKAARKFCR